MEPEFVEDSHRIPANWWDMRYSGLEENGKPKQPEFAKCGKNVKSIHEMTDDVPMSLGPAAVTVTPGRETPSASETVPLTAPVCRED